MFKDSTEFNKINDFYKQYYLYQTAPVGKYLLKQIVYYPNEIFLPCKDFPNYLISDHGNIYNITNKCIKMPCINTHSGDLVTSLYNNGKSKDIIIHRLVAMTFMPIENPENYVVCHINGDRLCPFLWNLEWREARDINNKPVCGEDVWNSNYTNEQVQEIINYCLQSYYPEQIAYFMNIPYTKNFYNFIIKLKNKKVYTFLTKNTIFPNLRNSSNISRMTFDLVERYCIMLNQNIPYPDIAKILNVQYDSYFLYIIWKIKRGLLFPDLAIKYNLWEPK